MGYLYFSSVFDAINLAFSRSLGQNEIGDEGAIGLGKSLEINTTLTELKYVLSNQPKPPHSISRPGWATFIFRVFLIRQPYVFSQSVR